MEKYEEIPVEVSDPYMDQIEPIQSFDECSVDTLLIENVMKMQYVKPSAVQKYVVPYLIFRRDIMACAQTGSGKTASYLFPIIAKMIQDGPPQLPKDLPHSLYSNAAFPVALILAPTRELALQINEESTKFCIETGIKTVTIIGGEGNRGEQMQKLRHGVDILVATPGRLIEYLGNKKISLNLISYIVIDEADRMLDMGFIPQIRNILTNYNINLDNKETVMCSATFPKEIQMLAQEFLNRYAFISIGRVGSTTDLIQQIVEQVEEDQKRMRLHD